MSAAPLIRLALLLLVLRIGALLFVLIAFLLALTGCGTGVCAVSGNRD